MQVTLFDYEGSACCAKARWGLAEEGVRWDRFRIDILAFDHKAANYVARDPRGLVPTAEIDGEFHAGTHELLKTVANNTRSGKVWPDAAQRQAAVETWLQRVDTFHLAYGALLYEEIFLPAHRARPTELREAMLGRIADERTRSWMRRMIASGIAADRIDLALKAIQVGFNEADAALAQSKWLAGPWFSLADITFYPYVDSVMHKVTDLWFDRMPNLRRWLADMRSRPAYTAAIVSFPWNDELWGAAMAAPGGGGYRLVG